MKFNNFKNLRKMSDSKYKLKAMFNGIPLEFGSQTRVTNDAITDKQGKFLLKNHPLGEDLFESFPKNTAKAEAKADSKAEAEADSKADSKAEAKADSKADSKAEAKADSKADSKAEAKAEAK